MAEGFFQNPGALASRFLDTDTVPWIDSGPGNKMKVLYYDKDSGMLTLLTRLDPGAGRILRHRRVQDQRGKDR